MKVTQGISGQAKPNFQQLVDLLSSSHLLEEKTRVNLYLPKALVQVMDTLAADRSRSDLVKELVINQVKKSQKDQPKAVDPYGMFSSAKITNQDINEVTKSWGRHVDKLVNEL